jgi:transcriptional regulator with XRE-family HTH domain
MTDQASTQVTLAARSGIPKATIARILAGTVDSNVDAIAALAHALDVQSSSLLEDPVEATQRSAQFRDKVLSLPPDARASISAFMDSLAQPQARVDVASRMHSLEAS